MDEVYRRTDPERLPWSIPDPPEPLVALIESGQLKPCRAIDLGCGVGHTAIYLAEQGYDVTGVDISPTAIAQAERNAAGRGVRCAFVVADLLGDLGEVPGMFDLAYDWEVLHHIYPGQRQRYVSNVYSKLNAGGVYVSVCFAESDPHFGGQGKHRETPLGTRLYFSSEEEIRRLLAPRLDILDLRTIEVRGKPAPHAAIYALALRRPNSP